MINRIIKPTAEFLHGPFSSVDRCSWNSVAHLASSQISLIIWLLPKNSELRYAVITVCITPINLVEQSQAQMHLAILFETATHCAGNSVVAEVKTSGSLKSVYSIHHQSFRRLMHNIWCYLLIVCPIMSFYLQVLSSEGIDSSACIAVFTESHRFLFNCGEGIQRLCVEHKVRLSKIRAVMFSDFSPQNVFGLPGLWFCFPRITITHVHY